MKKLLRDFNKDTFGILNNRMYSMNKNGSKTQRIPLENVIEIRSKEVENNNFIIG